jgi:hypothetical protein
MSETPKSGTPKSGTPKSGTPKPGTPEVTTPEFSRPVEPGRIARVGQENTVTATPEERAALARRFGLPSIEALSCRFTLRPLAGGVVLAEGVLAARLHQVCVVSLDPFPAMIGEEFAVRFVPEDTLSPEIDLGAEDEVPMTGGLIDLGELAAEQLALALDPYPRRPGAELPEGARDADGGAFAALAALRRPN